MAGNCIVSTRSPTPLAVATERADVWLGRHATGSQCAAVGEAEGAGAVHRHASKRFFRRAPARQPAARRRRARELFRRMLFNILIDNTDDHEKNHALMTVAPAGHGRYRLTPAYDVLPTDSGQGLHQFVIGLDAADGTPSNAMSQSELFGYDTREEAAAEVARVIEVVNGWREHFATCGVSPRDIESLASQIDGQELLSQRETFDAKSFATPAGRVRRRSPFAG